MGSDKENKRMGDALEESEYGDFLEEVGEKIDATVKETDLLDFAASQAVVNARFPLFVAQCREIQMKQMATLIRGAYESRGWGSLSNPLPALVHAGLHFYQREDIPAVVKQRFLDAGFLTLGYKIDNGLAVSMVGPEITTAESPSINTAYDFRPIGYAYDNAWAIACDNQSDIFSRRYALYLINALYTVNSALTQIPRSQTSQPDDIQWPGFDPFDGLITILESPREFDSFSTEIIFLAMNIARGDDRIGQCLGLCQDSPRYGIPALLAWDFINRGKDHRPTHKEIMDIVGRLIESQSFDPAKLYDSVEKTIAGARTVFGDKKDIGAQEAILRMRDLREFIIGHCSTRS